MRRAVADWRDRYLLAAATSVNAVAVEATETFERRLAEKMRDDPLADLFEGARPELDAVVRKRCLERVGALLDSAARDLRLIDVRGEAAALLLLRDGWPALPHEPRAPAPEPGGPASTKDAWSAALGLGRRLADLDRTIVTEAVRAGARATVVLGDKVRELAGRHDRVRARVRSHLQGWLFDGTRERPAVLAHLEAAIDAAAAALRKELA